MQAARNLLRNFKEIETTLFVINIVGKSSAQIASMLARINLLKVRFFKCRKWLTRKILRRSMHLLTIIGIKTKIAIYSENKFNVEILIL